MKLADCLPITKQAKVAVALAEQKEALETVHQALKENLAGFLLIGDLETIKRRGDKYNLDLSKADIIDVGDEKRACGIAADAAAAGNVQAVMKGHVHTSVFTRSLLDKSRGLVPSGGLISHVSLFLTEGYHKPLLMTDCAVNIDPDLEKKQAILQNALQIARRLGISCPKAALITPVEKVSERITSTIHAQQLVQLQRQKQVFGHAAVEGPLSFDAAVSAEAARIKHITGEVPGDADILLFPNLDAGNAVNKALALFSRSEHAGIIAGLTIPAVLTSRGDSAATRLLSLRFALAVL